MEITLPSNGAVVQPGKVICVGRNYAAHAAEMRAAVPPAPILFLKPPSALIGHGGRIVLPAASSDVHHEVELVAVIGRGGKDIPESKALDHVDAYAVGLDITARDLQAAAKAQGEPWTISKGFDTFAPLGPLAAAHAVGDPQGLQIRLTVNGEVRQVGHTGNMLFSVARLVAFCSSVFTLMPGDLIFTGTPEGVAPIQDGDVLEATITGLPPLRLRVRREPVMQAS
jgi:acylpyruvate hydrolase